MKKMHNIILLLLFLQCATDRSPLETDVAANYQNNTWIRFTNWVETSIPVRLDSSLDLINKGKINWYNPYNRVHIKDVWPDKELSSRTEQTADVLTLEFLPHPDYTFSSWGGIMRFLPSSTPDLNESDSLEIWLKGDSCAMHIDLGLLSEDIIPNQRLDTEDVNVNGLLDEGEDTGMDEMDGPDPDEIWHPHENAAVINGMAEPYDFWDLNQDKVKEPEEPWSYDNWQVPCINSYMYRMVNGTEGNVAMRNKHYPDTEDLNANGKLDTVNNYFSYSINLGETGPCVIGYTVYSDGAKEGERTGWYQVRIPLNDPVMVVGNPDWSDIKMIRIWLDHSTRGMNYISIADISFQ
jgi:hypothetical protein